MTEETVNPTVVEPALERTRRRLRPSCLSDEVLTKAAEAGDERLRARIKANRPHEPISIEIMDKVVEESVKYFSDLAKQCNISE